LTQNNFTPKSIKLSTYTSDDEKTKSSHINKVHGGKDANGRFTLTATNEINDSTFAQANFTTPVDGTEISSDYWAEGAYPAYNWLPVFIYVGRSRSSAPLVSSDN